MTTSLTIGSIIVLHNTAPNGGYLDTYGWVANKPEFWNVAGTERIFVSTYAHADRGGGTTSWQILSADGKPDGAPLNVGDRIHLRNMYTDTDYLDCCGWIEHIGPFMNEDFAQEPERKVRCTVFTTAMPNRDNGTGIWQIESAEKKHGERVCAGDAISLVNSYPADGIVFEVERAETGSLVAYGEVSDVVVFRDFQERELLVFTSTNDAVKREHGMWIIALSPAYSSVNADDTWFNLNRPELLRGRVRAMQRTTSITTLTIRDAIYAISGVELSDSQQQSDNILLDQVLQSKSQRATPDVIDYPMQVKQLCTLYALSKLLTVFDQETIQGLMYQVLDQHRAKTSPPLDLIRTCFQCIATDHEIIQQAVMQRRWEKSNGTYVQNALAGELVLMDKIALKAIAPFQHLLPHHDQPLAVITYFSPKTHIHHLPYTNQCVIVGINYDRISPSDAVTQTTTNDSLASFELLAIPHEVGHYIYRYGQIADVPCHHLSEQFRNTPYYHWCEELFADTYGCIIAGPLSALSMQAFLESDDKKQAWREDEEHPTPILRPYILAEMLRVLGELDPVYKFSTVADYLDQRWSERLQQWGYEPVDDRAGRPTRLYLPDDTSTQLERIINVARVIKNVRPIIEKFARQLLNVRRNAKGAIPWSRSNSNIASDYINDMSLLTGTAAIAEQIELTVLLDAKPTIIDHAKDDDAEGRLLRYVSEWDNSGPNGIGGHR